MTLSGDEFVEVLEDLRGEEESFPLEVDLPLE